MRRIVNCMLHVGALFAVEAYQPQPQLTIAIKNGCSFIGAESATPGEVSNADAR